MKHAIVTGGCGFIGGHLVSRLQADGWKVTVLDLALAPEPNIWFDVASSTLGPIEPVDVIVHLAAKAGVRQSFVEHEAYIRTNVIGTQRMLDLAVRLGVKRFVFASSSSVYGTNPRTPWSECHTPCPASPYAATKIAGEAMGEVYAKAFDIQFTALRFFTVYGPNQRKGLAIRKFAELMLQGKPIDVYGDRRSTRDYTYIDDVVEAIVLSMGYESTGFDEFNIGSGEPIRLDEMLFQLGSTLGHRPAIHALPAQLGDVDHTYADISKAERLLGWTPKVDFSEGIYLFTEWLKGQKVMAGAV